MAAQTKRALRESDAASMDARTSETTRIGSRIYVADGQLSAAEHHAVSHRGRTLPSDEAHRQDISPRNRARWTRVRGETLCEATSYAEWNGILSWRIRYLARRSSSTGAHSPCGRYGLYRT